jgi:hypothetical protein
MRLLLFCDKDAEMAVKLGKNHSIFSLRQTEGENKNTTPRGGSLAVNFNERMKPL